MSDFYFTLLPHRQKVLSLTPSCSQALSVWSLHVSLHVCVSSRQVFWLSPKVQRHAISVVRLTSDSKLLIGVKVSVNGCLSPCVSPLTDWQPVQDVLYLSPP